jgi:hypothetical protein
LGAIGLIRKSTALVDASATDSCKGAILRPSTSQRRPQWLGAHAVLAARSGKHAIVEKPMALSLDDSDEMIAPL